MLSLKTFFFLVIICCIFWLSQYMQIWKCYKLFLGLQCTCMEILGRVNLSFVGDEQILALPSKGQNCSSGLSLPRSWRLEATSQYTCRFVSESMKMFKLRVGCLGHQLWESGKPSCLRMAGGTKIISSVFFKQGQHHHNHISTKRW